MERYEILPHPSDGKFRAFGRTFEEACANAALALASFMWDWEKVSPAADREVRAAGRDRGQLLVRFLNEIIFIAESEGFVFGAVEGLEIKSGPDGFDLRAVLRGGRRPAGVDITGGVKAATYNELLIEEGDGGGWSVQAVVDL